MMTTYIAFLRAINVGGRRIKMDQLRAHFEALGFRKVDTLLASGNVIFNCNCSDRKILSQKIESHLQDQLGYQVATFIRTLPELDRISLYQPFNRNDLETAGAFNVAFLKHALSETALRQLSTLTTDIDRFHAHDREVYWLCKVKQSESQFSNTLFEKKLGVVATFRNIKTVLRLVAKYSSKE